MTVQAQLHETLAGLNEVTKDLDKVQSEIDRLLQHQQWLLERKKDLESTANRLQAECQRERPDVSKSDFPWSKKLHSLKKTTFGVDEFRPLQERTMNATLSGQDCILVMPTGGGKSLCYQLPALISKGFTLVVSPLVSLMEDQTMSLEQLGIKATLLNAGLPQDRVKVVHQAMIDPKSELKLIYVTPEKIAKSKRFMAQLEKAYKRGLLARIAIDEVHCCSQWGHDFRPDYKILGLLKRQFPDAPVMGLTATATNSVLEDVKKILNIQGCVVYRASYNRANLYYQIVPKPSKHTACIEEIVKLINGKFKNQSGIIYCFSRRESEQVAFDLQALGIRAEPYHANMEVSSRSAVHRRWKSNKIQVVVATVAFGMGIDKPDVRFVIHHSLSKSIENYYQESGRAGRDEKRADCIVFFQVSDMFRQSTMVVVEQTGLEKLYNMVAYCISQVKCRRSLLASHFGERWDGKVACNSMCDNCSNNAQACRKDIQSDCRSIYDILSQSVKRDQRLTANKVADIMHGKTVDGIQLNKGSKSKSPKMPRSMMDQMLAFLIIEGYIKEDFHFTPYSTISYLIPGPRSSHLNTSQDHPIILKTADPKQKRIVDPVPKQNKIAGSETKQKKAVASRKTSQESGRTKKPDAKKEQVDNDIQDIDGASRNGVVVIDLSDGSSDEDVVGPTRKVKKQRISIIDDDEEEECIVCDDDDEDSKTPLHKSNPLQKDSKVRNKLSREKNPKIKKKALPQESAHEQQNGDASSSKKKSILGKRKEGDHRSKGGHDETPSKKHKPGGHDETPSRKHKPNLEVSSERKTKKKSTKHVHESKQNKPSSSTHSLSHKKIQKEKTPPLSAENKTSPISVEGVKPHNSTKLGESSKSSSRDNSMLNSSCVSNVDELDELQTVYSEQLASLEMKDDDDLTDSEDDFQ